MGRASDSRLEAPSPSLHSRRRRHPTPPRDPNTVRGSGRPEITDDNISILGKIFVKCFPNFESSRKKDAFFFERFDSILSRFFYKLGEAIADHTGYFILVPLFVTLVFSTGYQRMNWTDDPEFLFSPLNGRARQERAVVEKYFPTDTSHHFDASRLIRNGRYVHFLITAKGLKNIFDEEIWADLMAFENFSLTHTFYDDKGNPFTYEDVCAKNGGECVKNQFLELGERIPEFKRREFKFPFPVMLNPKTFNNYVFPTYFGGVKLYPDNTIMSAEALRLHYWGTTEPKEADHLSSIWEKQFLELFLNGTLSALAPSLEITIHNSRTAELEFQENTRSVLPYFIGTFFVMVTFCLVTVTMGDCVRSKTLLGLAGIISAVLATTTAFGFLIYCGMPFIGINMAAPFLMLGIGIDDTFVMLAAWQRARFQDTVKERLSSAYADAAVSITITSLTNMLSFFVGYVTPFASVQIFCIYTGMSVLVTYVWHITFFGACLAICAKLEKKQLHNVTCKPVKPVSESKEESYFYRACCSGGISKDDPYNPEDNQPHAIMVLFRDYVAEFINMPIIKGVVLLCFLVYISLAVYGITVVQEGMQTRKLARYDSYTIPFYNMIDKYFSTFSYRPMIVFSGNITYSDPATSDAILKFMDLVESHESIGDPLYTECWLRQWMRYMDKNGKYLGLNNTDEPTYIRNLKEYFLAGEQNNFVLDVAFNEDSTRIIASRFIVQSVDVMDAVSDRKLLQDLRRWADESPFEITVFHPLYLFFDQLTLVRSTSLTAISLAAVVMMVISFVFIPNPICSLWVGFSIVSIEIGVIGYMTHWGVNLDPISMIQLIMCIGFSVDFTAHICYAYLSARVNTPDERVRECLYSLGLPVMQGALSTLLGVLTLIFVPSYIFITFFKTVFLVIFFGAIHGLFLIPVFLSLFGPGSCSKNEKKFNEVENYEIMKLPTSNNHQTDAVSARPSPTKELQVPPHLPSQERQLNRAANFLSSTDANHVNGAGRSEDESRNTNGHAIAP
ncbi:Protein patched/dispatched [Trinorchestia longiramus]|nr:Protein patched/dispatched [Trinorchestia longiramus]